MQEQIKKEVQEIFRKVFVNTTIILFDNLTAEEIDGWDSLSHLELITELETHFKIRFSFEEVMSFENVGQMVSCIFEKAPRKIV